jgi:hypothetical protein
MPSAPKLTTEDQPARNPGVPRQCPAKVSGNLIRIAELAVGMLLLLLPAVSFAQTQIDLASQSKRVDFSAATSTKPMKSGTSFPGTCTVGELFFKTNSPPGQNVYGCSATDTWSVQGDGGGSSNLPPMAGNSGKVLSTDGAVAQWSSPGGDVTGSVNALTVQRLQSRAVSATAPQAGQALIWNATAGAWEPQAVTVGQGTMTLENNGLTVGTRGVGNFIAGPGIVNAMTDTGSRIDIQQSMDSAVVQTRTGLQSGNTLYCASTSGSAVTYTCSMNPALGTYTAGMVLRWKPDVNGTGGATTLNIDSLGARTVQLPDGSNPTTADIVAGTLNHIWYDGTTFRLMGMPGRVPSGVRPVCGSTLRGRLWQVFGAAGVKDEVAVCAKDASDGYAWRVLY